MLRRSRSTIAYSRRTIPSRIRKRVRRERAWANSRFLTGKRPVRNDKRF
jgi:hypothetical protein